MSQTHRILLLNGPNLNMLGAREPKHYGSISLASIEEKIQTLATQHNVKVECFQANSEEKLINKVIVWLPIGKFTRYGEIFKRSMWKNGNDSISK